MRGIVLPIVALDHLDARAHVAGEQIDVDAVQEAQRRVRMSKRVWGEPVANMGLVQLREHEELGEQLLEGADRTNDALDLFLVAGPPRARMREDWIVGLGELRSIPQAFKIGLDERLCDDDAAARLGAFIHVKVDVLLAPVLDVFNVAPAELLVLPTRAQARADHDQDVVAQKLAHLHLVGTAFLRELSRRRVELPILR